MSQENGNPEAAALAEPTLAVPATGAADNPQIVDTVQSALDTFNEDNPVTPEEADAPTEEVDVPAEEAGTPAEEAAAADVAPTLPEAYRRSAKSRGWTDEEIDQFAVQNPDLAVKTFERMHESRVAEIEQWAALGRKAREGRSADSVPAEISQPKPLELKPIDTKALAELYGNEELVAAIAGPVNATIEALRPLVQGAQEAQVRAQQAEMQALGKLVEDFFASKEIAPYTEFYGDGKATRTPEQDDAFRRVIDTADALVAGAKAQGRNISAEEALRAAHDSVSAQFRQKVITQQVRQSVQQRGKGITLKPTNRGAENTGVPQNRAELLSRTTERLAAAFS